MKSNVKKSLLLCLCFVLVAAIVIGGTLAYLTDRDAAVNVFTMGDVEIELTEDFEQGAQLMPGKDINKDVAITNTGSSPAYVWYTYAIPAALDDPDNASNNVVHINHSGRTWDDYASNSKYWEDGQNEALPEAKTWDVDYTVSKNVDINGELYNVYAVLYHGALAAGETTEVGMTNVYLDKRVDYNKNDGKYYLVENGNVTEITYDLTNVLIYVNAYAIQKEGFENVYEAYDAFYTQWSDKAANYETVATASNVDELKAALAADDSDKIVLTGDTYDFGGETVALPDGVTITGTADAEVANVRFSVADDQSAAFENVTFTDATTVQAVQDGALTFTGCEFNITPAKLNNNSRAAAIIGSHQYATVDLTVDNCVFNYTEGSADAYNAAIFMWSSVKNVKIIDSTFNDYGFVAVKLMNVADDADIAIEGNTFKMSAAGSANYWYNTAVQILPQHNKAFAVSVKNNAFNGGYQTANDLTAEYGISGDASIVTELSGMNYSFALTNATFTQSGNTVNGAAATADNFACKF